MTSLFDSAVQNLVCLLRTLLALNDIGLGLVGLLGHGGQCLGLYALWRGRGKPGAGYPADGGSTVPALVQRPQDELTLLARRTGSTSLGSIETDVLPLQIAHSLLERHIEVDGLQVIDFLAGVLGQFAHDILSRLVDFLGDFRRVPTKCTHRRHIRSLGGFDFSLSLALWFIQLTNLSQLFHSRLLLPSQL